MAGLLLAITVVAGWSVQQEFERQREQAQDRLAALAELRAAQVDNWLAQYDSQAKFLSSSQPFAEQFIAWVDRGDQTAGDRLLNRLVEFRRANGIDGVLLVNAAGQVLASETPADRAIDETLLQAVKKALASGKPVHTGIYRRDDADASLRLDVVVPLVNSGSPARGLIVLRVDSRRELFPMLAVWPLPSDSGETVLWHAKGERLLALNDVRGQPGSAGQISEVLATSRLPPALVMRGEVQPGQPMQASDYRGVPVLAVVRPVRGSDWWLVAKQDVAEFEQPAWRHARLVAAVAALALLGLGSRLWWQRQALQQARREGDAHRRQLNALGMLEAIASSLLDAIFAKDLQGRYVFYNAVAGRHVGKAPADVLGRSDVELFGAITGAALAANDAAVMARAGPLVFEEQVPGADGERVVLCAKGPLLDPAGRVMGLYGVAHDVTDMRNAELALREREAHYRAVFSVLSEGVMLADIGPGSSIAFRVRSRAGSVLPQVSMQENSAMNHGLLLAFDDEHAAALALSTALSLPMALVARHRFPDGESRLRLPPVLPSRLLLFRGLQQPNEKLVELLITLPAARALGAREILLVSPYLAYMRQDMAFTPGEAVSQRHIAALLAAQVDGLITIDPHLHRIDSLDEVMPGCRSLALSAAPLLGAWVAQQVPGALLLGPDEEALQWVAAAGRAHRLDHAVCVKQRFGDRDVRVTLPDVALQGRAVVLMDDVASTGRTLVEAATAALAAGAASVDVAVTHALFVGDALAQLRAAGVRHVWSSDAVPHATAVVGTSGLLAAAVRTFWADWPR